MSKTFFLVGLFFSSFFVSVYAQEQLSSAEEKWALGLYDYASKKNMIKAKMNNLRLMFPTKNYQTVYANGTPTSFTMKGDKNPSRDRLKGKSVLFEIKKGFLFMNNKETGVEAVIPAASVKLVELKFHRLLNTPYPRHSGTLGGAIAVGDLNNDGKKDIITSGIQHIKAVTLIYLHKKTGQGFDAPIKTHGLPGFDKGVCLKLGDVDKDGDLDIVVYGRTGPAAETALFKVFKNDGSANFTADCDLGVQLPLEDFEDIAGAWGKAATHKDNKDDEKVKGVYNALGWSKGVLELVDLDNDSDLDIIFAGAKGTESGTDTGGMMVQRDWETSGVFLNDGKGSYSYLTSKEYPLAGLPKDPATQPQRSYPGLAKVNRGFSCSADFNKDGKIDVVIFGQANMGPKANAGIPETQRNGKPIAESYLGKGDGTFTLVKNAGLPGLIDGSAEAVDLNKDGKMDLIILGNTGHPRDPAGGRVTKIFFGNGDGTFKLDTKQTYASVPNNNNCIVPVMTGGIGYGDLDLDGDLDLVIAGNNNDRSLYVYINNNGKFAYAEYQKMKQGIGTNNTRGLASSDAVTECDVLVTDIDKDGDMDIIINGRGGSTQLLLFQNKLK